LPLALAAVVSISEKIGCVPQTLSDWVKRAEVDSGKHAGVPTDVADKMKTPDRRLAGQQNGACQLRPRCSGTDAS